MLAHALPETAVEKTNLWSSLETTTPLTYYTKRIKSRSVHVLVTTILLLDILINMSWGSNNVKQLYFMQCQCRIIKSQKDFLYTHDWIIT